MIKTEKRALRMLRQGATIRRAWGGFRIQFEPNFSSGGSSDSILPKLVVALEEAGKIKRVDDRTSRVGEEWGLA